MSLDQRQNRELVEVIQWGGDPKRAGSEPPVCVKLAPGSHTLTATAQYPVAQFAKTVSSTFNVAPDGGLTNYFDGAGNITNRVFTNGKTQVLRWDADGRLVRVIQRDSPNNGFDWAAIYDAMGRRLRTLQTNIVNGVVQSRQTNDSYFDPEVEFGEIGVAVNGVRTWKVVGPDVDGQFGSMQGVGGFENTIREVGLTNCPVIADYFGHTLAIVANYPGFGLAPVWSPVRVSGYGPVPGYNVPVLTANNRLGEVTLWRSKRIDPTGFYWLGARYYDSVGGRFLSPDPAGFAGSTWDLYSFANNDPINQFDPDGRFGKQVGAGLSAMSDVVAGMGNGLGHWGSATYAAMGNMFDSAASSMVSPWNPLTAVRYFNGGADADPSYMRNYELGSSAYQMGHQLGYAGAELGFQVGLAYGAGGLARVSGVAARGSAGISGINFTERTVYALQWESTQIQIRSRVLVNIQANRAATLDIANGLATMEARAAAKTPTETLALVPKGTRSLGQWGEARLAQVLGGAGVKPAKPFSTDLGSRYVDRLVNGIAHESKAGLNVRLTSSIELQILKDAELIQAGRVQGAHWHFFQGAQPDVLEVLTKHGIGYTVY